MMTDMTTWQINVRENSLPLLEALALRVPAAPRGLLRQLCKKQRVTLDGRVTAAEQQVQAGQTIAVRDSLRWQECLEQSRLQPGQVLYEDMQCLVLDKPAGLPVHRAFGHDDNLLQRVEEFLRMRRENFRVAAVHRLDIGTSGALLFGKGRAAISQLGKMIMAGSATKRYLAVVPGNIGEGGDLTSPIPSRGLARAALTRYRPLAETAGFTLLELELVTGRQHQIRRQLAEAGWPVLGDTRYGGPALPGHDRIFLHCHQLIFPQPETGTVVAISAPLAVELQVALRKLGFPGVFSNGTAG
jgi:RluA family pseudouridine synthase